MDLSPPRAWAEIDLDALKKNYQYALTQSNGAEVMAVVKANAYGHGVENVVRALEEFQPAFYGVANVAEAREVRAFLPKARIYLLGAANPSEYAEIVQAGYTPCVSNLAELQIYKELAESAGVVMPLHVAVDTGMGRGGFQPDDPAFTEALNFQHSHVQIEGVGSHLPVADEDEGFTQKQFQVFQSCCPPDLRYKHLANSAGILHFPSGGCNLIRPGLMLYGCSPLPEYQEHLSPVMSLYSRISLLRKVPEGASVSYGRTFITQRPSIIAVIGIGYADGVQRSLSGKNAHVFINGHRAPIVGRVTMDQIMVDVTDHSRVEIGDQVEIFGKNIPVSEMSSQAGTIPWEIFTGIAPRVTRVPL